jgi:hypothetical protein
VGVKLAHQALLGTNRYSRCFLIKDRHEGGRDHVRKWTLAIP